jgi:cytochrome P450
MALTPAAADRDTLLAHLRPSEPVHWSDVLGCWVLTRYDDIAAALRDPRWGRRPPASGEPAAPIDVSAIQRLMDNLFLTMDPPDHTRLRGLVSRAFTPASIADMEPRIDAILAELLDRLEGRRSFDVVADVGVQLPAIVIAELLGVPVADLPRFKRWSDEVAVILDPTPETDWSSVEVSIGEFAAYVRDLSAERRTRPRDDLLSALVARHDGDALTEEELVSTVILLITAGHETTTNLIANGVLTLFRNPTQLDRLHADPACASTAVEEILRYEPPVQATFRVAQASMSTDGHEILPGQEVMLSLAAGNRDPSVFDDPDTFDIRRSPNRHLAFALGSHFCIGAPLARLEGRIALTGLVTRFPGLCLSPDAPAPAWRPSLVFRSLDQLIVEPGGAK